MIRVAKRFVNHQTFEAERERVDDILDEESEIRTFSLFPSNLYRKMSRPIHYRKGGLHIVSAPKNGNVNDILFKI
ncbi:MAG: hypothetical protein MUP41_03215 [Desulfobacterales bacterium]|nr:hypothetical protein [Desulfobacterales bacterium]